MTENAGTAATTEEAPAEGTATAAPETGTPQTPDEVTTLRSRNAGLDAKVTELSKAAAAAEARAQEAFDKLQAYEAGKVNADEALRAQLQAKEQELERTRREAASVKLQAQFPETYAVFGEAIVDFGAEKLAEAEARLKGVALPEESHTPPPVSNNAPRPQAGSAKSPEDMTLAELKDYMGREFANLRWEDITRHNG